MTFKSYREESRIDFGVITKGNITAEEIQLGTLLRIADATEVMTKRYSELIAERDTYKRRYEEKSEANKRLAHSNAALRGVINRMKRRTP